MVRHMTDLKTPGWKAVLAVTVAAGALLWHVLACTESPMAFSPSGKELAFVTMSPYGHEKLGLAGKHVYRMCVLSEGKRVKVVERTDKHMLTAPTYSPNGKHLAYFRIPLLTEKAATELRERIDKRRKALEDIGRLTAAPGATTKAAEPNEPETKDLTLPPLAKAVEFYKNALLGPHVPVQLVVRDAMATDLVLATATIDLPMSDFQSDRPEGLMFLYLLARPQYSPDGKWVYFCAGNVAFAINPKTGARRILAAPVTVAFLSPDGKTLAAVGDDHLAFVRTDGQKTTAIRWDKQLSASGFAWVDDRTFALLSPEDKEDKKVDLHFVRTDGKLLRSMPLPKPGSLSKESTGELAVAPDGKHVVLAYGKEVQFLDGKGKVLSTWRGDKQVLSQPTFTPDGRRVAFKRIGEGPDGQTVVTDIVFFSAAGKEFARVKIPPPPTKEPEK